jgi:hypothetical protein
MDNTLKMNKKWVLLFIFKNKSLVLYNYGNK